MTELSPLQKARLGFKPVLPATLAAGIKKVAVIEGEKTECVKDQEQIKKLFANTTANALLPSNRAEEQSFAARNIGVILSGGQAPGGHNVVAGLYDALKQANPQSKLYGFLGGPSGIIDGQYIEFTDEIIDAYRNTGGFDIIGSGRTKLETEEQFEKSLANCKKLDISGIVIIGGDDSNTNAQCLQNGLLLKMQVFRLSAVPKQLTAT